MFDSIIYNASAFNTEKYELGNVPHLPSAGWDKFTWLPIYNYSLSCSTANYKGKCVTIPSQHLHVKFSF